MKKMILYISTFMLLVLMSCITQKQVNSLDLDKRKLYPYFENDKWGFTNEMGDIAIQPQFDSVLFFSEGLAVVKQDEKYGYIKKNGEWHIKPKYKKASSFSHKNAGVTKKSKSYCINIKGRRIRSKDCLISGWGSCYSPTFADPKKYMVKKNNKYEVLFNYWLLKDLENEKRVIDTTNIKIDTFFRFGRSVLLLKKANKYAFYRCSSIWSKVFVVDDFNNYEPIDKSFKNNEFRFVYDEVKYEKGEQFAKVRINDKWGVVNSEGIIVIPIEYLNIKLDRYNLALVGFEKNKKGYKRYGEYDCIKGILAEGKEYFKRCK